MIRIILLLAIFSLSFAQTDSSRIDTTCDSPLFENYDIFSDYRFSLSVSRFIKWGSIGVSSGILIGALIAPHEEIGIVPLVSGIGFGIIGSSTGSISGFFKGQHLNAIKEKDPKFYFPRSHFGYGGRLYPSFAERGEPSHWLTGLFLAYRNMRSEFYFNEIQLGMNVSEWDPGFSDIPYIPGSGSISYTYNIQLLKIKEDKIFSPLWGLTFGYAQEDNENRKLAGPLLGLSTGARVNFYDFFFVDIKLYAEVSGIYFQLIEHYDYPLNRNLHLGMVLGAYIF